MTDRPGPSDDSLQRQLERATRPVRASGRAAAEGAAPRAETDPETAALRDGWKALNQTLRHLPPQAVAPGLVHRVLRETSRRQARRQAIRWSLAAVAAALLLIVIGTVWFRPGEPQPQVAAPANSPNSPARQRIVDTQVPSPESVPYVDPSGRDDASNLVERDVADDPWTSLDDDIARVQSDVDDLQYRWRLSTSFLEYVAQKFRELEWELAMTDL